jgi:hypothetical protein
MPKHTILCRDPHTKDVFYLRAARGEGDARYHVASDDDEPSLDLPDDVEQLEAILAGWREGKHSVAGVIGDDYGYLPHAEVGRVQ